MADLALGLLRGLQEGVKSYNSRASELEGIQAREREKAADLERRRLEREQDVGLLKEKSDYERAFEKQKLKLAAREKGLNIDFDENGLLVDKGYDPQYLAMKRKETSSGSGSYNDPLKQLKLEEELSARTQSPVTGYNKTNRERLTDVDKRTLKGAASSVQSFNNSLNSLKEKVGVASKMDLLNPYSDVSKAIKQDLRNLQLAYKNEDFAKLGVLAGPDLQLLEQVIEDPGSLSNVLSGKEGVLSRYDQLQNTVNKGFDQRLENYGLLKGDTPQAQVPQKPVISSEDQQALQWAMQNPRDPRAQKILQMNKMNAGR